MLKEYSELNPYKILLNIIFTIFYMAAHIFTPGKTAWNKT